jgi:predicted CoA-binding protein
MRRVIFVLAIIVAAGQRGYEVFAVNPNADQVEGDRCFHDLKSIPGGVDAVVIGTRPESATEVFAVEVAWEPGLLGREGRRGWGRRRSKSARLGGG